MIELVLKGSVEEVKNQLMQLANTFGVVVPETMKKEAVKKVVEEMSEEVAEPTKVKKEPAKKTAKKEEVAEELTFEKDIKPIAIKAIKTHQSEIKEFLDGLGLAKLSQAEDQEQLKQIKAFLEGLV